jgi:hypothetical protein
MPFSATRCRLELLVWGLAMVRGDDLAIDTDFVHSNISEDNEIQGAKWGATADSF